MIIGVQKAGTSALDQYLRSHSQIRMATIKELHFFDNDHLFQNENVHYASLKKFYPANKKKYLYGESTPNYIYWRPSIERIKKYNPKIKLIAILRNPIERAYSHWNMEFSKGKEKRKFIDCILKEIKEINSGVKKQDRVNSYVERGIYSEQIKELDKFFPSDQVLFIKYEDFLLNQKMTVEKVLSFLKVRVDEYMFKKIEKNKISYSTAIGENETDLLAKFYQDEICQVEKILSWNCEDWKI